jgi:putative oxidoreductase
MKPLFLIGRIMFGGFFIYNGINHLKNHGMLSQYAGAKKVPQPEAAVIASGLAILAGGTSLVLGLKPKYGAAAIIAFLATVTPSMHDFWRAEDPNQRMADMIHFSKNLALLGAAVALLGVEEPWGLAVASHEPNFFERVREAARVLAG